MVNVAWVSAGLRCGFSRPVGTGEVSRARFPGAKATGLLSRIPTGLETAQPDANGNEAAGERDTNFTNFHEETAPKVNAYCRLSLRDWKLRSLVSLEGRFSAGREEPAAQPRHRRPVVESYLEPPQFLSIFCRVREAPPYRG